MHPLSLAGLNDDDNLRVNDDAQTAPNLVQSNFGELCTMLRNAKEKGPGRPEDWEKQRKNAAIFPYAR